MKIYTDDSFQPVYENRPYVRSDGTRYPADYPKSQIEGLRLVTLADKPTDPDLFVTGFTINAQNQQVWQTRDKTASEVVGHKALLKSYLASYRWQVETGGITVGGATIQTDRETRSNLVASRILAKEDADYTLKWKTGSGAFVTLNATAIIAAANAAAAHVAKCFTSEETVSAAIDDGTHTTEADVKAAFDTAMSA